MPPPHPNGPSVLPKRVLIYILSAYVLVQFGWWAYMLVDLNSELHRLRIALLETAGMPLPEVQVLQPEIDRKLALRVWMVLGEGAVFLVILFIGFRAVQRSIRDELDLARRQKNFLLSVTHELKSPLAAIRLQLQTLLARSLSEEQQRKLYQRALSDTDRLQGLVENLLLVNRMEAGKLPLRLERTDLGATVSAWLPQLFANELDSGLLRTQIADGICISADQDALRSILSNLIENAFKYAPGSPVTVSAGQEGGMAVLRVADEGPGISETDRQLVFTRFYRGGEEETRKTKGTGIGLYLVRQLVVMHGGTIEASANRPRGAVFTVTIPLEAEK